MPTLTDLANAIAQIENTNPAYNNPGAISGTGDTGTSFGSGIGIYSSLEAGQAALQNQLNTIVSGNSKYYSPSTTLSQFGSTYSGGDPNYGINLSSILGVPANTPLSAFTNTGTTGSTTASTGSSGTSSSGSISGAVSTATGNIARIFSGHSLEDFIIIIVGIVLVTAGLFAFKTTRTVIQVAGKSARTAAEVAAG